MASSRDDFIIAIRSAFLKKSTQQKFSLLTLVFLSIFIIVLSGINFSAIKKIKTVINEIVYRSSFIVSLPENFIKDSYISAIKHYIDNYDRIFTDIEIFTFLNVYFNFSKLTFSKFDPTPDEGTIYHTLKNNIKHDKIRFNHTYIRK